MSESENDSDDLRKKLNEKNNATESSSEEDKNKSLKIEEDKKNKNKDLKKENIKKEDIKIEEDIKKEDIKKEDIKKEEIENIKESKENNKIDNKTNIECKMTKKDNPNDYLPNNFILSQELNESKAIESKINFSIDNDNDIKKNNIKKENNDNIINKEIENKKEENKKNENNDNNNEKNNKNKNKKKNDSSSSSQYSKSDDNNDDDNNSNENEDKEDNDEKEDFQKKFKNNKFSKSEFFDDNKNQKNYYNNKKQYSYNNSSNYNEPNNFNINKNKRNKKDITNDKFYKANSEIIKQISDLFYEEQITIEDACKILKLIYLSPRMTIFEIMNMIICEKNIILLEKQKFEENSQSQYENRYSIYENKNPGDLTIEHKNVLDNYKIYNKDTNPKLKKDFHYTSNEDKRRKLEKNSDNIYTYVPILKEGDRYKNSETNIYCNNIFELNYHSLKYKTILCRNKDCYYKKNNIDYLCPFSHNIDTDFRIIYKYQNPKICIFMNSLVKNKTIPFESYLQHYEIPRNFSLNDFKIFPCAFQDKCGYDSHLCLMYHNLDEKRRPPLLFRYSKNECECKKKGVYKPEKCPYGDFCMNVHSRAEYNYHKDHFRKIFPCTRKKQNGLCIFYKTCYGKHEEDKNNNYNNTFNSISSFNSNNTIKISNKNLNEKEKNNEEINFDLKKQINEKIEEEKNNLNKKIDKASNLLKIFLCKNCNNIPNSNEYEFLKECKHILCDDCFKKSIKENKSCPICKKEIGINAVFKLQFQK